MHRSSSCCRTTRAWWVKHGPACAVPSHLTQLGTSVGHLATCYGCFLAERRSQLLSHSLELYKKASSEMLGPGFCSPLLPSPLGKTSWAGWATVRTGSTRVTSAKLLRAAWLAGTRHWGWPGPQGRALRGAEIGQQGSCLFAEGLKPQAVQDYGCARLQMLFLMKVKSKHIC